MSPWGMGLGGGGVRAHLLQSRRKQSVTAGQGNFLSAGYRIAPLHSKGNSVIDVKLKDFREGNGV
jgi:hypothetical protein